MKRWMTALLVGCAISAQAVELQSFNEIANHVENGKSIRLVIDFEGCNPKPPVANLRAYASPHAIMIRKDYLQFASSPLTTNNPGFPGKPVLENVTYRINDQNEAQIINRVILLPDYTIANEFKSVCKLGTDIKVYS